MSADHISNPTKTTSGENAQTLPTASSNADIEFEAFCKKYFGNTEPGFVKKSGNYVNSQPKEHAKDLFVFKNESHSNQDGKINGDYKEFYTADYAINGEKLNKNLDDSKQQISKSAVGIDFSNLSINKKDENLGKLPNAIINKDTSDDNMKPFVIDNDKKVMNYWDCIYRYSKEESKTTSEPSTIIDTKNYFNYNYENGFTNNIKSETVKETISNFNGKSIVNNEPRTNYLVENNKFNLNEFKTEESVKSQVKPIEIVTLEQEKNIHEKKVEVTEADDINRKSFAFKSEFRNKTPKTPIGISIPTSVAISQVTADNTQKIKSSLKVLKKFHQILMLYLTLSNF
jgi:hypothetical protein